ncbi:sulfite exporter TauE/SafE family protein, partial [Oenococcus oeni]
MNVVFLIVIGLIVGTFVILFGGGGAAIYLGILTGVVGLNASTAASTSLVTVLPSLILGVWTYYRQGTIKTRLGNQMLITAIPAVIIGSLISSYIPDNLYKWIVGIILILLGINMLFQKQKSQVDPVMSKQINRKDRFKAGIFGIIGGLMVGVAGMSGGAPIIAGLFLIGLSTVNAVATSAYVLVFMSAIGTVFHIVGSQVDWNAGISLMVGALIGAAIGPRLLTRLTKSKVGKY